MRLSREKAFLDVKEREKVPKGDMNNSYERPDALRFAPPIHDGFSLLADTRELLAPKHIHYAVPSNPGP